MKPHFVQTEAVMRELERSGNRWMWSEMQNSTPVTSEKNTI